jgi:Leucine-rich repeat (LRR) protein
MIASQMEHKVNTFSLLFLILVTYQSDSITVIKSGDKPDLLFKSRMLKFEGMVLADANIFRPTPRFDYKSLWFEDCDADFLSRFLSMGLSSKSISFNSVATIQLQVFDNVKNLEHLEVKFCEGWNCAELFQSIKGTSIRELSIEDCELVGKLSLPAYPKKLRNLSLIGSDFTDDSIGNIGDLTDLLTLNLSNNHLTNRSVAKLSSLQKLENLSLAKNNVTSLHGIRNLTSLKTLDVANCGISSLEDLNSLRHVELLDISKNDFQSLAPLSSMKRLEVLRLANVNIAEMSDGFPDLPQLMFLDLTNADRELVESALTMLAKNKTEIRQIRLRGAEISDRSIRDLAAINSLTTVDLRATAVTSKMLRALAEKSPVSDLILSEKAIEPGTIDTAVSLFDNVYWDRNGLIYQVPQPSKN